MSENKISYFQDGNWWQVLFNKEEFGCASSDEASEIFDKLEKVVERERFKISKLEAENKELKEREKKLVGKLMTTTGCAYTWDDHYPEEKHDVECEVCNFLKELGIKDKE